MSISDTSSQLGLAILTLCVSCVCVIGPVSAGQQDSIPYPRADSAKAVVSASATMLGGDTIRVNHRLYNHGGSVQRIESFAITTAAKPISMAPGSRVGWIRSWEIVADSAAMLWTAVESATVAVADSSPVLSHVSVGVVGIVTFYVRGYVPAPPFDDTIPDLYKARLTIWEDSYKAETIAVVPFPADMTALGLAQRLVALADTACAPFLDLQWVSDNQICNSSNAEHRLAVQAIQAGNLPLACTRMSDFVSRVDGLPDNKIKPEGRALLRLNALHFRRTHCP